jgi:hypothetical protein
MEPYGNMDFSGNHQGIGNHQGTFIEGTIREYGIFRGQSGNMETFSGKRAIPFKYRRPSALLVAV